jgi:hypothetical protein
VKLDINLVGVHVGWGQNDNQVGKLLGRKMMDEIDFFALCSHARSFLVKNFAIPVLVDRNTIRSLAIPIFRASHNGQKIATIVKQWVAGFDQRSLG